METDLAQLKRLGIYHYVVAVWPCFNTLLSALGLFACTWTALNPKRFSEPATPDVLAFCVFLLVLNSTMAVLWIIAGRNYRKHLGGYRFCFVVAIISCFFFPVGTMLGAHALGVLSRRSVKELFRGQAALLPASAPPLPKAYSRNST